jgi:hypothetical protein
MHELHIRVFIRELGICLVDFVRFLATENMNEEVELRFLNVFLKTGDRSQIFQWTYKWLIED